MKLQDFTKNVYSQWGEDGIIEKIFEKIGTDTQTCVEFGAWDGFHLSNTANLWTNGWKGILIEGHKRRFRHLVKNVASYNCVCINAYVGIGPGDCLEALLKNNGISESIDFLSIDIDGNDYHIFSSLSKLRPRLVVIEYNPTIPPELDLYAEPGNYFGCSVAALVRVAKEKGYSLVTTTETNTFFVRDDLCHLLGEFDTTFNSIVIRKYLNYLITGFDGRFVVTIPPPYGVSKPLKEKLVGNVYYPKRRRWWKSTLI